MNAKDYQLNKDLLDNRKAVLFSVNYNNYDKILDHGFYYL